MYLYHESTYVEDEFFAVISYKPNEKDKANRLVRKIFLTLYLNYEIEDDGNEISFPVKGWIEYKQVKEVFWQFINRV